jgi:uncharacterized protein YcaQ
MKHTLSAEQVRTLRLYAQRLVTAPPERDGHQEQSAAQVVAALCSVQAQEPPAAMLALRPRAAGLTFGDVERALTVDRSIVRTWAMRGTLHLLPARDLPWLLSLFGPVYIAKSKRRYAELALDEQTLARGMAALREVLAEAEPMTRAEIVEYLSSQGIRLQGQAEYYLLHHAGLQGVICCGPERVDGRAGEPTYVLMERWLKPGRSLDHEEACAELARRYLAAYGPATLDDFASWAGLPMPDVRAGWQRIAGETVVVDAAGEEAAMLEVHADRLDRSNMEGPIIKLLPRFDTYWLGYRRRDLSVPTRFAKRIHPGGGILNAALLVDGCAAGTWRTRTRRDHLEVIVEPFEPLTSPVQAALEAEVADVGRFLGIETVLVTREEQGA